jgi:flagellar hook-associated protein 1 FlgK
MSLMSNLYTGVSGLRTSQNSLNTTSHNLANVETKGYVRQQVVQVDSSYIKWGETHISTLQYGLGVDIAAVRQVRDIFLDKSYRKEFGRQGFYEAQYETVQEIESMFGELEGVAFQNSLENFWASLQELGKEPDSIVARSAMIETAVSFIDRAENISKQLKDYQINLNSQIQNKVDRINEIATKVYDLNDKIQTYESSGIERAHDLRDNRNRLLDELGQMIHITYKENTSGVVTVNAEGVPLVTEDRTHTMDTVRISDDSYMIKPVWSDLGSVDVYRLDVGTSSANNTDIGSLKGLLVSRGLDHGNYTDIPVATNFNTNEAYQNAVAVYNNQVKPSVIMTVQAQFDQLIHGIVTMINDTLSPNINATIPPGATIAYLDGDKVGQTVTLTDNEELLVLDEDNAPVGMDENMTMGEGLFNRKSMERYHTIEITYTDGTKQNFRVYNKEDKTDNYSLFTLGEIEVNQEVLSNYSKIPLSSNDGTGEYDVKTAEALLTLWQTPFATLSPDTLTKNNYNEYYTSFIGELANRGQQLNTISQNQASMAASIDNKRQEVSAVSSDEELTNLIMYQHAYNASARYISVVSEMLEHIVTRL